MTETLDDAVRLVRQIMSDEESDINQPFEEALERLLAINDPYKLRSAILLLDDKFDLQDLMWLVLHGVERFKNEDVVRSYIDVLPDFFEKAPEWSMRMLGRFLNSESYIKLVKKEVVHASYEQKNCIFQMCFLLKQRNPSQFTNSADFVLS